MLNPKVEKILSHTGSRILFRAPNGGIFTTEIFQTDGRGNTDNRLPNTIASFSPSKRVAIPPITQAIPGEGGTFFCLTKGRFLEIDGDSR